MVSKKTPFASRDELIAKLTAEVSELRSHKQLEHFAREVSTNIMIVLGNMPFGNCPDIAKTAFRYAAERQTTTAHLYINRLPK